MASQPSLSESLQASIILQKHQDEQEQEDEQPRKGLGFCFQLMMVSSLFGIEMCMAFEQIYGILIFQYFGVPKSLLSLGGLLCGVSSIFIVPTIGCLVDRGPNPLKRKRIVLYIGMTLFLTGLSFLAICSFIKMASVKNLLHEDILANNFSSTLAATIYSQQTFHYSNESTTQPDAAKTEVYEHEPSSSTATVVLSIAGFTLLDMGYDTSMSLTRAYILECSPKFQHVKILVLATILQSSGGLVLSFIGIWDIPQLLQSFFHVDGIAATVVFFCGLLAIAIISGYLSTTLTGYFVTRKYNSLFNHQTERSMNKNLGRLRTYLKIPRFKQSHNESNSSRKQRPYCPDILHTDDVSSMTKPLLLEDSFKAFGYLALEASTSSMNNNFNSNSEARIDAKNESPQNPQLSSVSDEGNSISLNKKREYRKNATTEVEKESSYNIESHKDQEGEDSQRPKNSQTPASVQELITSMSNDLGKFSARQPQGEKLPLSQGLEVVADEERKSLRKKMIIKLTLLSVSVFFGFGFLLGFVLYVSNVLTVSIYKGDPTALPGTRGKELYEKGLQMAAVGNLALYSTYTVLSMNNKKVIDVLGERREYALYLSTFLVVLLSFIVSQKEEVYYVAMVTCGMIRAALFTLPFILANKFTDEVKEEVYYVAMVTCGMIRAALFTLPFILANKFTDEVETDAKLGRKKNHTGKIMSLIGTLFAFQYICLSALVGPVLEATNNIWFPLMYSAGCGVMSLLAFLPLFNIK